MSNCVLKQERGCALVWWKVTTTGRLNTRLTTPLRSRAFLMRGTLPRRKVVTMATRSIIPATPAMLLHWARCREQAGDLLGSGVCLRAAIYRQLLQLAREHHCLPKRRGDRERAAILASSLHAAGAIGDCDYEMLHSAIEVGNAAAHVGCIDRAALQCGIRTAELIVENWAEPSEALQAAAGGAL